MFYEAYWWLQRKVRGVCCTIPSAHFLQANGIILDLAWQCNFFYHSIGSPYNSAFFAENHSQHAPVGVISVLLLWFGGDAAVVGVASSAIFCTARLMGRLTTPEAANN